MIIKDIEKEYMKENIPDFGPGDTVKVMVKIVESGKERAQAFEGVVLKRQGGGLRETFTVRKVVQGVGVEKTFPIHSPKVEEIKVLKKGKVRRAKLYYLRGKVGARASKIEAAE
ncbi:MAG: 50S ribosomal protein L19 [Candidatus Saganbacteria bacterium]|nr:50S ribosomal protein L19 [Candidatus Saganbacteria bacterium]